MTIFFPDVSHYDIDRGVTLEPNTVAVIAKSTHGTLFCDSGYPVFRAQASRVGAYFAVYHWLNHGNGVAQGRYCASIVGRTPVMVDVEDTPTNSGYSGTNTVADVVDFAIAHRAAGGICRLVYLPHWYWQDHMGSPSLTPLRDNGLALVSSSYTSYSDTGPGWDAYGGLSPVQWQYSDSQPYGGASSDFNAFRGSLAQYKMFVEGSSGMELIDPVPATGQNVGVVLSDVWNMVMLGHSGFVKTDVHYIGRQLNALVAAIAADDARDRATIAAINALSDVIRAGGGSVDAASIIAEIRAVANDAATVAAALKAELDAAATREADLEHRLAVALGG